MKRISMCHSTCCLIFFFQFAKDGKRLYHDDGVDSFVYTLEDGYDYVFEHVTHIEVF